MSASAQRVPIVCAGRLYADLVFSGLRKFPELGKEEFCGALTVSPGGGSVITAAYLAARGHPVHLLANIPRAPFDEELQSVIRSLGVETGLCRTMPEGADPQITVAIVSGGERAFVTRRVGAAVPRGAQDAIKGTGASHLHIGELATLVEHPGLLVAAREAGMTVSLDCSWEEELFSPGVTQQIGSVDVFLPNESEADALCAAGLTMPMAPVTAVKMGEKGSAVFSQGNRLKKSGKSVDVIDTIGAGDAFNAGFLSAWLAGDPPDDWLTAGNADGALAVQHAGGLGALRRD